MGDIAPILSAILIAFHAIAAAASPHVLITRDEAPASDGADQSDRNVTLGSCTWIVNHKCPDDEHVKMYLFTRRNPNDRQLVHVDESWEKSNLSTSFFDPADPVKIIIHGYNADMFLTPLIDMKDEYLQRGKYNLFFVDWSRLAPGPCYLSAVHNARHCGECAGKLVRRILESGTDDIHVIGFSLGAHVTNFLALSVQPFVLPRITGLDPAMPLYVTVSKDSKLDASDARFVDVVHTNAFLQGKIERCGHVDFYMNGAIFQPGCMTQGSNPFACSHHRAPDYFSESIRSFRGFWGWPCRSYINYLLGLCPRNNELVVAGEDCPNTARGMYLITTNAEAPFAMGRWIDDSPADAARIGAELAEMQTQSMRKSEPLMRSIDEWGKIEGEFNNRQRPPAHFAFDAMDDYQWDAEGGNGLDLASHRTTTVKYPLPKRSQFATAYSSGETLSDQGDQEPAISKESFLALYHKLFGQNAKID